MLVNGLPPVEEEPAAHLQGLVLENGWEVGARIPKESGATGGHFSVSYTVVNRDGRKAFLKALNFHAATQGPGDLVDQLHLFTSAYIFERDLLAECRNRKMNNVIRLLDHGHAEVPKAGPLLSKVPYLILEPADGDIRAFQARSGKLDCAWGFRVIKDVLLGLSQLHSANTAHQDLKPSNVLTQNGGGVMKLGDLGRADRRGVEGPFSKLRIPGAVVYAPPEQQYGSFGGEWEERRAADLYLAGSLGVQLFMGHCLSAILQSNLSPEFRVTSWSGSFEEVVPYLQSAHAKVISSLEHEVLLHTNDSRTAEEFAAAISQMTSPSPVDRGHPRDRAARSISSYSVQRFISLMDRLSSRAYHKVLGVNTSGQPDRR